MRYFLLCFTIGFMLFAGCSETNKSPTNAEDGYWVTINQAAGDDYEKNGNSYLSFPFNEAIFKSVNHDALSCAVVSKKLNANQKIHVKPMALLTYEEYNQTQYCIVSVPTDSTMISVPMDNFSDFMIKNSPIRNIIELWQLNKCGLGCSKLVHWKDDSAAKLLLEKHLEN